MQFYETPTPNDEEKLILLAAFFLRGFLPELYGELRAIYDAELNRSVLILQDDVPYS